MTNASGSSLEPIERPMCSGEWIRGSGGHRFHAPCERPADWWHPDDMWSYCDEHLKKHDAKFYVRWDPT